MGTMNRVVRLVLGLLLGISVSQFAAAQYPQKPIRLIVPFVAGGTPDTIARILGLSMSAALGQHIVVDNRPGAGGLLGTEIASQAMPDGYTLLIGGTSSFTITPALHRTTAKYNAIRDFDHISLLASTQLLVASLPAFPAKTVEALIAMARRQPGRLRYASSGNGTVPHMFGELFKHYAEVDVQHIPYRGGPQAWTALLSGEVELLVGQVQQAVPYVKAGKIRVYAVFGPKRSGALPNVPTFEERGIKHLRQVVWYSIAAPKATPPSIIRRINLEANRALALPDVRRHFESLGLTPFPSTPEAATRFIRSEIPRWAEAVRISGARVD